MVKGEAEAESPPSSSSPLVGKDSLRYQLISFQLFPDPVRKSTFRAHHCLTFVDVRGETVD